MLVYNEFEQRFSTSSRVECYQATRLSDIDTQPGPAGDQFSIFTVGVQGTITGQTRIRGVRGPDGPLGYGLLGVGCEMHAATPGGAGRGHHGVQPAARRLPRRKAMRCTGREFPAAATGAVTGR